MILKRCYTLRVTHVYLPGDAALHLRIPPALKTSPWLMRHENVFLLQSYSIGSGNTR